MGIGMGGGTGTGTGMGSRKNYLGVGGGGGWSPFSNPPPPTSRRGLQGPALLACRVFTSGGGGVNRAPPKLGWGGSGKGLNGQAPLISHYEVRRQRRRKIFSSTKIGRFFFSPNIWQMMTCLNPLDALIPKIPFSFFSDFWVWVTSEARGSDSVGFWGSCQLSPFWGRGWGPAEGLY